MTWTSVDRVLWRMYHPPFMCSPVSQWVYKLIMPTIEAHHYGDVIMNTISSQITSLTIVYSTIYSGADQSKHQSSTSLAFVWGIHRGPVNSPHKWPVTRKMFPFDDVIMLTWKIVIKPVTNSHMSYASYAIVTCANLRTVCIIKILIKAPRTFTLFQSWAHKTFAKWLPNGPLTRYVKLRVAHAPGVGGGGGGRFFPPLRVRKRSRHSVHNPQI